MKYNSRNRRINTRGQFTGEKLLEKKLSKRLQEIARESKIRLQALTRDKLISELRHQIYLSYVSTGDGSYEHRRLLPKNVYAVIEGDTIQVKLIDDHYKGVDSKGNIIDVPVQDVYNYLKFGTKKHAKSIVYPYLDENNDISFAHYKATPPHNFEARTREVMDMFLDDVANNPETALKPYLEKYKNKRL